MTTILASGNEAWGFFGTMQRAGADPQAAWDVASAMIAAKTGGSLEAVRTFLDSRHGRHFADDVVGELAAAGPEKAIETAIARWQRWRITRATQRDLGIPTGLPYLTGFVSHLEIEDEIDA